MAAGATQGDPALPGDRARRNVRPEQHGQGGHTSVETMGASSDSDDFSFGQTISHYSSGFPVQTICYLLGIVSYKVHTNLLILKDFHVTRLKVYN